MDATGYHDRGMVPAGESRPLTIRAIVHEAEEGGYWAEVPAIPGCVTQGETLEELRVNLRDAVEGCLSAETLLPQDGDGRPLSIAM